MALEIWYDQDTAHDYGPGEPAILVETINELDAFVERVLAETANNTVPPMIEVSVAGDQASPVLHVGLGQEKGFIAFMAADGGWTRGDAALTGTVPYVYVGNGSEVPASAEVPIEVVRHGLREFMEAGEKPANVAWTSV